MAWDQSFSTENGVGGWMEQSFTTGLASGKDAEISKLSERLPVPVRIQDLVDSVHTSADKYCLGDYQFVTVMTIGTIKSMQVENATHVYVLQDPDSLEKEYLVNKFHGDGAKRDYMEDPVAEGARVLAIGKLRSFDGQNSIMAFKMHEIVDDQEYEAFVLEAQIATIYFSKGVPHLLKSGTGKMLQGTMAGAPTEQAQAQASRSSHSNGDVSFSNNAFNGEASTQPDRIYPANNDNQQSQPVGDKKETPIFVGQRKQIMDLLARERANLGEEGATFEMVKSMLKAPSTKSLQADLEFLVNEGHIYNTTCDDSYALIK